MIRTSWGSVRAGFTGRDRTWATAGCRLLLSDIAPYREMVRDGLTATLLAGPVRRALAETLPGATPVTGPPWPDRAP